jgi:CDP-diacylglycerol--serine O-phosphatidyltransferase
VRVATQSSIRHFSMIRSFEAADFFTLANGLFGMAAVLEALKFVANGDPSRIGYAAALVVTALVFDILDGKVARLRGAASALGRELDSLADLVSFGVAPAAIAFAIGMDRVLDQAVLIFFVLCGLSRLARFNVTAATLADERGKVRYFEGTPIPTSVVPLGLAVAAFHHGDLFPVTVLGVTFHLTVLLFFVSGCLMISKTLRIPKP